MKRLICFVLIITVITSPPTFIEDLYTPVARAASELTLDDRTAKYKYGYNFLTSAEKDFYTRIYNNCVSKNIGTISVLTADGYVSKTGFQINTSFNSTVEVEKVFRYFMADNPEFFWLQNRCSMVLSGGKVVLVSFFSLYSKETVLSYQAAVDKKIDQYLEGVSSLSDFKKELWIHDRIANNVKYDSRYTDSPPESHTIYGALVNNIAVCEGYAKLFKLLLNRLSIECIFVTGTSNSVAHAWNAVKIDGSWYYTDVTSDDPVSSADIVSHKYFNVTTEFLYRNGFTIDGSSDQYPLPSVSGTDANWYSHMKTLSSSSSVYDFAYNAAKTVELSELKPYGTTTLYWTFKVSGNILSVVNELARKRTSIISEANNMTEGATIISVLNDGVYFPDQKSGIVTVLLLVQKTSSNSQGNSSALGTSSEDIVLVPVITDPPQNTSSMVSGSSQAGNGSSTDNVVDVDTMSSLPEDFSKYLENDTDVGSIVNAVSTQLTSVAQGALPLILFIITAVILAAGGAAAVIVIKVKKKRAQTDIDNKSDPEE